MVWVLNSVHKFNYCCPCSYPRCLHLLSPRSHPPYFLPLLWLGGASVKEFGGKTMPADVGPVDARQKMMSAVRGPTFLPTPTILQTDDLAFIGIFDNSSSVGSTAHWTPIKVEQKIKDSSEMLEMVRQATPSGRSLPHRHETTYCSSSNNIDIIISSP
jgi:hypothetical protein